MDKIKTMFTMQLELNNRTNGTDWMLTGMTKEGKEINWKRCIYMECAELIDSLPWKHWKDIDGEADMNNAIVEIVDIWHFIMSALISENSVNAIHIAKKSL